MLSPAFHVAALTAATAAALIVALVAQDAVKAASKPDVKSACMVGGSTDCIAASIAAHGSAYSPTQRRIMNGHVRAAVAKLNKAEKAAASKHVRGVR